MTKHDYIDNCWTLKHLSNKNNNFSFSPHAHFNSTTSRSAASAADNKMYECVLVDLIISSYLFVPKSSVGTTYWLWFETVDPTCPMIPSSIPITAEYKQTKRLMRDKSNRVHWFETDSNLWFICKLFISSRISFKLIFCIYKQIWGSVSMLEETFGELNLSYDLHGCSPFIVMAL